MSIAESAPRMSRLKDHVLRLQGEECKNGHKVFPPRDICPKCGGSATEPFQFSGKGTVFSWTTVYQAPEEYENQAPYTLALIKLEEGPLVTARLTDINRDQIQFNMPVEMVTRKITEDGETGPIFYAYAFRSPIPREDS